MDRYAMSVGLYGVVFLLTTVSANFLLKATSLNGKTCYVNGKRRSTFIIICIVAFLPTIVSGLRYGIGTDYHLTYVRYFDTCRTGNYYGNTYEYLYYALNYIVSTLGGNVNIVLYISSVITFLCYIKGMLYYGQKISIGVSTLVFMLLSYNNSMNNVRQWVAVAIVFYGVRYCFEKKFTKYVFTIIAAAGFHVSAAFMLPMYFIVSRKDSNNIEAHEGKILSKTKRNLICIALLALIVISQFAISIFESIGLGYYIPYFTKIKYIGYINWLAIARYLPWILSMIYLIMKKSKNDYLIYVSTIFALIGVIVEIIAMHVSVGGFEQIHRMANYFTCFFSVVAGAISQGCKAFRKEYAIKKNGYAIFMILILAITIFMWVNDIVINNANETLPYVTIFG